MVGRDSPMTSGATDGPTTTAPEGIRLQKILAAAGVASRRVVENYIVAGRIRVNGDVVTELGTRVHPDTDRVTVDGIAVQLDTQKVYYVLNKPVGVVCSLRDEQGRPDLRCYTDELGERVFSVGRLDQDTSGLLLLTNDGDLAHILAHPSFGVTKTHIAKVQGRVTGQVVQRLRQGVDLEDGLIAADQVRLLSQDGPGVGTGHDGGERGSGTRRGTGAGHSSLMELTLHSGRNRIVRRMLGEVRHPIIVLVRRSFGPLNLGTLRTGRVRPVTRAELGELLTSVRAAEVRLAADRESPSVGVGQASRGTGQASHGTGQVSHGTGQVSGATGQASRSTVHGEN